MASKSYKSLGSLVTEVMTCVGDDEINEAIANGWCPYGMPTIPVGFSEFHWLLVKKQDEEES